MSCRTLSIAGLKEPICHKNKQFCCHTPDLNVEQQINTHCILTNCACSKISSLRQRCRCTYLQHTVLDWRQKHTYMSRPSTPVWTWQKENRSGYRCMKFKHYHFHHNCTLTTFCLGCPPRSTLNWSLHLPTLFFPNKLIYHTLEEINFYVHFVKLYLQQATPVRPVVWKGTFLGLKANYNKMPRTPLQLVVQTRNVHSTQS